MSRISCRHRSVAARVELGRTGVRAAACDLPPVRRSRKRFTVGVAVAAALVVVGLAGLQIPGRERPNRPSELPGRQSGSARPAGTSSCPRPPSRCWRSRTGRRSGWRPRTRGRVVEVNSRGARFALDDGKVSVDIVQRPHAQWIFEAGPFRVNVHGTSFTIAWNPADAVFEVRLISGAISVASPVAGPEIQMRAGQIAQGEPARSDEHPRTMGTMSARESAIAGDGRRSPHPPRSSRRRTAPSGRRSRRAGRTADGWRALSENKAADIVADAGSPRSGGGARARGQRGPLGAGQRRPICGPVCAGAPSSERPPTVASRVGSVAGSGLLAGPPARRRSQRSGEPSDGTIATWPKRTMAWVSRMLLAGR